MKWYGALIILYILLAITYVIINIMILITKYS